MRTGCTSGMAALLCMLACSCDLRRLDLALAGVSPFASPGVAARVDQTLAQSPLEVSLDLESAFVDVDREAVLAFADGMADDLGFWLLATTGTASIDDAEVALWQGGGPDVFAVRWAQWLREHDVYTRNEQRLSAGVPTGYIYVHQDELALLFAHMAWRLDLRTELIRSPVHHYLLWHEPGTDRVRGVEPTCFRCVDVFGAVAHSKERSVGRRLTFTEDFFPSGRGGIRNPDPLPPGMYQPVDQTSLASDLIVGLTARHGAGIEALEARLGEGPAVAQALWALHLSRGLTAYLDGDRQTLAQADEALSSLRRGHNAALSPAPDDLVLSAAMSGDASRLRPVFAHYEANGPVELLRSDAHAVAMWVDLRSTPPSEVDWNARIIPLMNRHRRDPERFSELCRLGDVALRNVEQTLDELMPECPSPQP